MYCKRLTGLILFALMLSGCTQTRLLSTPYPRWGQTIELSGAGPTRLHHLQLLDNDRAEACILIVHGMNEYIGRYADIAAYFADRAIVAGLDLTAHGLSNSVIAEADQRLRNGSGPQNIDKAFAEQAELSDLRTTHDDIDRALRFLIDHCNQQKSGKTIPVFILSHSLGSLASAGYLLQNQDANLKKRIGGIILAGPAFSVTRVPGWRGWLQNPFIRFSYHTHEQFLNPHNEALPLLLFNQLLALVTVPIQDGVIELLSLPALRNIFSPSTPNWVTFYLSNWEEERKRHNADPLIIRRSVLSYVLAVEKAIIAFRQLMADFSVPYLLIYTEHDPITPAWGNVDFENITRNNHPDNEVLRLEGENHHEQLFSKPAMRTDIMQHIDAWIDKRINAIVD